MNPFSDALKFLTRGEWPIYLLWLLAGERDCSGLESECRSKAAHSKGHMDVFGADTARQHVVAADTLEAAALLHRSSICA